MEIPKKEGCRYIIIKHKTKDKTEENSLISCKKESTAAVCGSPGAKSTVVVFIVSGT